MKISELKSKSDQELEMTLKELNEKLRKLKFDLAERKLKNTGEILKTRRTVARILTLMKEKNIK